MKVTVQFYSRLKEIAGNDPLVFDISEKTTVGALLDFLCQRFPGLNDWRPHLLVAVRLDYAMPDALLRDGDEISVMPPVQGG